MPIKSSIGKFLNKNLSSIKSPFDNSIYEFQNIEELSNLLFGFLDTDLQEPIVSKVAERFYKFIEIIISAPKDEVPDAILSLATNYEAFIKKIACLLYRDSSPEYWYGNETTKGLKGTTLGLLIDGKISKKYGVSNARHITLQTPLLPQDGIQNDIIIFVKDEIRNTVHEASEIKLPDLYYYASLVIACYLIGIEENIISIRRDQMPEYKYLGKIANDSQLSKLDNLYVELLGQDSNSEISMMGQKIQDEYDLLNLIESFESQEEEDEDKDSVGVIENISTIISNNQRILLIGSPGSGKSTTLKKLLFRNALSIINNEVQNYKIPFLIEANNIKSKNRPIRSAILEQLDKEVVVERLFTSGKIQLLIDGFNEASPEFKKAIEKDINRLLGRYPGISIVVTDRKYGFSRKLKLPVFELRSLEENQIREFIIKNSKSNGERIWNELSANERMLELASNPLMLKMYLTVLIKNKNPKNRGQLFSLFLNTIFAREKGKSKQLISNIDLKNSLLADLAFKIRSKGKVSINKDLFIHYLNNSIEYENINVSSHDLFQELIQNNVVSVSDENIVSFLHETYQEYYSALYLKRSFLISNQIEVDFDNVSWMETIMLCFDILDKHEQREKFFKVLYKGNSRSDIQKPYEELDSSDFNSKIFIACKLANQYKFDHELIYEEAKRYLSNYMTYFQYNYLKTGTNIFPLSDLLSAIATLNDPKLTEKLFLHPFWVEMWLYKSDKNSNNSNSGNVNREVIDSFALNAQDLHLVIDCIRKSEMSYSIFDSVLKELTYLRSKFLQNQSLKKLIEYYDTNTFNLRVFKLILIQDLSIISRYSFKENSADINSKVLISLSKYHGDDAEVRKIIVAEIKGSMYGFNFISKVLNNFFLKGYTEEVFEITDSYLSSDYGNIHWFYPYLSRLQFSNIPRSVQRFISENNADLNTSQWLHPDVLLEKLEGEPDLTSALSKFNSLIKKAGLAHRYVGEIDDLRLGVIVDIHISLVKVYDIQSKKYTGILLPENEIALVNKNQLVVIEENGQLISVDQKDLKEDSIWMDSIVSIVKPENNMGFIRRFDYKNLQKDYFFHFDNCNFIPKKGDQVRFIPSFNSSKQYRNHPTALLITKLEAPRCLIESFEKLEQREIYKLIAYDVSTREKIALDIPRNKLHKISTFVDIEPGDVFEYTSIGYDYYGNKKIRLTRKHLN